ncbi:sugar-binding protein [Caballeronia humi]|jgi:ribose transport system substrate-binding protein|uniref:Periplasmic binding protein/LacI transcriptional regulator n=1 Tax=Caballeronia humi TaxID=326474 RepID=A0A158HT19_9BURK|nr:sugar-binding protein [Caballeronia humi]SAL47139.1 periplasmic binding protein/LacI transcriptional regulator [Caballeronia humi]
MTRIVLGAVTAAVLFGLAVAPHAQAADKKVFAVVPKALGVPFYADAEKGCKEEAAKIGAECLFTGPAQLDDAEQGRIVRDLITKKVAGIAIAPNNPDSISGVISAAMAKNIPVVTFDSDAPKTKRVAFIGTNNEAGGESGGEAFAKALPKGGNYAVITGGLSAANLNDRIKGFKSKLGPNFKEVSGSPFPCNDDSSTAIQLIQDILAKNPNIDGIFFAGGWPMFAPEAYMRALKNKAADLKGGKFVIVSFDTLPTQIKLLKDGYATTLIGQRPTKMGSESVDQLNKILKGEKVPPVTDTGVDIVNSSNVDKFTAGK